MGQGVPFGSAGVDRLARLLLMPGHAGMSNRQLAIKLGVSKDTVQHYRPAAVALAESWKTTPVSDADLRGIERALVAEAQAGNVSAAKILFDRVKAMATALVTPPPPADMLPTIAELEEALALLRAGGQ